MKVFWTETKAQVLVAFLEAKERKDLLCLGIEV